MIEKLIVSNELFDSGFMGCVLRTEEDVFGEYPTSDECFSCLLEVFEQEGDLPIYSSDACDYFGFKKIEKRSEGIAVIQNDAIIVLSPAIKHIEVTEGYELTKENLLDFIDDEDEDLLNWVKLAIDDIELEGSFNETEMPLEVADAIRALYMK